MTATIDLLDCAATSASIARLSLRTARLSIRGGLHPSQTRTDVEYARRRLTQAIASLDEALQHIERSSPCMPSDDEEENPGT